MMTDGLGSASDHRAFRGTVPAKHLGLKAEQRQEDQQEELGKLKSGVLGVRTIDKDMQRTLSWLQGDGGLPTAFGELLHPCEASAPQWLYKAPSVAGRVVKLGAKPGEVLSAISGFLRQGDVPGEVETVDAWTLRGVFFVDFCLVCVQIKIFSEPVAQTAVAHFQHTSGGDIVRFAELVGLVVGDVPGEVETVDAWTLRGVFFVDFCLVCVQIKIFSEPVAQTAVAHFQHTSGGDIVRFAELVGLVVKNLESGDIRGDFQQIASLDEDWFASDEFSDSELEAEPWPQRLKALLETAGPETPLASQEEVWRTLASWAATEPASRPVLVALLTSPSKVALVASTFARASSTPLSVLYPMAAAIRFAAMAPDACLLADDLLEALPALDELPPLVRRELALALPLLHGSGVETYRYSFSADDQCQRSTAGSMRPTIDSDEHGFVDDRYSLDATAAALALGCRGAPRRCATPSSTTPTASAASATNGSECHRAQTRGSRLALPASTTTSTSIEKVLLQGPRVALHRWTHSWDVSRPWHQHFSVTASLKIEHEAPSLIACQSNHSHGVAATCPSLLRETPWTNFNEQ
eukprot:CAMPEP_0203975600 /NCGR_PEP_ID=MMETSP0359-20131031/100693_1 /ASSEMBLY_ACC=CAM_ASM_000338 /TAXON_ID=268821 /ORGANISM="Scrippsiella Hangoei, Strain SHTV-5" /LENGTH=580 /DNA_ID=CAMNT_0050913801 /DNA_START=39 /DNA_END=1780 /DNA_ORIENTATION=-